MKTCKDCKEEKEQGEFYGVQGECKECTKSRVKKYVKHTNYDQKRQRYSKKRMFQHRYSGMKARIEGRTIKKYPVEGRELLSKEDFYDWCEKNMVKFDELYNKWKDSGWDRKLAPSLDRIKNEGGYTVDNIQWLSLSDNLKKDAYKTQTWKSLKRDEKGNFIKS